MKVSSRAMVLTGPNQFRAVRAAIRLVRQKRYPFEDLIYHRFKLEEAEQALRLVAGKIQVKQQSLNPFSYNLNLLASFKNHIDSHINIKKQKNTIRKTRR